MAVNYANALAAEIDFSGLVSTVKKEFSKSNKLNVEYLLIEKTFDTKLFRLCSFEKKNRLMLSMRIVLLFIAVLLKLLQQVIDLARSLWR
jgi:hypothetical protein